MNLYFLIIIPIFIGLFNYLIPFKKSFYLSLFTQLGLLIMSIFNFLNVKYTGFPIVDYLGSKSILGVSLYGDLVACVFVILVTFIFLVLNIYTFNDYLQDKLFQFLFLSLEGLVILMFLSGDVFNLFITIQLATIICSMLIMFKRDSRSIYDGLVYLMSNVIGILFFLFGVAMLYKMFGVLDIKHLKIAIGTADPKSLMIPYSLMLTGICVKCAMFPVFTWLPKAHGSPGSPPVVSALLCSLYVKGSIYIYIRIRDMFLPSVDMDSFFMALGIITSLLGIILALLQKDLKMILAYHTISQLGLIFLSVSTSIEYTYLGGILHIINHTLFKSLLFLAVGVIMYQYKTRDVYEIRDVLKRLPFTGFSILVGILGITGAPLFNGSISKYFIQSGVKGSWIEWFILLINFGTTLSFVKFGTILLPSKNKKEVVRAHESFPNSLAMIILSVACLVTGLIPTIFADFFLNMNINIDSSEYFKKGIFWIAFILISIFVYQFVLLKSSFFKKGLKVEVAFNNISLSIVSLFFIILFSFYQIAI